MELFLEILKMIGIIFLGFFISEAISAVFDKQGKSVKPYFSFIGIEFNQKDAQRLFLSLCLGGGIMVTLPYLIEFTKFEINGYLAYLITGISPTAVVFFVKKKFQEKTGIKETDIVRPSSGGHPDPDKEEK